MFRMIHDTTLPLDVGISVRNGTRYGRSLLLRLKYKSLLIIHHATD